MLELSRVWETSKASNGRQVYRIERVQESPFQNIYVPVLVRALAANLSYLRQQLSSDLTATTEADDAGELMVPMNANLAGRWLMLQGKRRQVDWSEVALISGAAVEVPLLPFSVLVDIGCSLQLGRLSHSTDCCCCWCCRQKKQRVVFRSVNTSHFLPVSGFCTLFQYFFSGEVPGRRLKTPSAPPKHAHHNGQSK